MMPELNDRSEAWSKYRDEMHKHGDRDSPKDAFFTGWDAREELVERLRERMTDELDREDLWMEEAYESVDKYMNTMTRRPLQEEIWAAGARWGYVAGVKSREADDG